MAAATCKAALRVRVEGVPVERQKEKAVAEAELVLPDEGIEGKVETRGDAPFGLGADVAAEAPAHPERGDVVVGAQQRPEDGE